MNRTSDNRRTLPAPGLITLLFYLVGMALCSLPAPSEDWPQWMGPRGDGASIQTGVFAVGGTTRLRESWRRPIGRGYSSVSVVGGRAFTMELQGSATYVLAVDLLYGRDIWRSGIPGSVAQQYNSSGPLSTPTIDQGRIFALNADGRLQALAAADGEPLWACDLVETFGASGTAYGFSTSPVVEGELLIVLVGGQPRNNLVAFNKTSGEVVWSVSHAKLGSYSSPVVGALARQRQIVVPAGDRLYAVHPTTGRLLWTYEGLTYPDRNPLLLTGDRIFIPLEDAGVMLKLKAEAKQVRPHEIWRTSYLQNSFSPAVYLDGTIYGFNGSFLTALNAVSGEVRWREAMSGGSLVLVDGYLLVLEESTGMLHLVVAKSEAFEERATVQIFRPGASSLTPPSYAAGRILLRNHEEMVACEILTGSGVTAINRAGSSSNPAAPNDR